ncbi:MAG TPA: hypothetical protein VJ793_20260 [Anaerolineae bacterium]|nr:hypothetical protein [Anaerolineae bacterium]
MRDEARRFAQRRRLQGALVERETLRQEARQISQVVQGRMFDE